LFLSANEWKLAFDFAIKEMWLDWGGFSSISKNSHRFKVEYTGENDASYHNGDSWYFMNNYAAIAMHRLDKVYYAKYIDRILHAGKEELLFSGFIGASAELSSSKELRSEGCLAQAWSAASLVELMFELKKQD
jgi:glycogen debranching enzyme